MTAVIVEAKNESFTKNSQPRKLKTQHEKEK